MSQGEDVERPASQRPTSRDVATLAGVSVGTVSNVLNRPDRVTKAKRERVEAAMRELGFVRNRSARQLRMGRGQTIGLLVPGIAGPYFMAVTRGVEQRVAEAGLLLLLSSSYGQSDRERSQLRQLEEQGVGGVIIGTSSVDVSTLTELQSRGTGVVLLDPPSSDGNLCSVSIDDATGAELAAKHLLDLGHRRICLVNGPQHLHQCRDRRAGLHRAVLDAGLDLEATVFEVVAPTPDATLGEKMVPRVLADPEPPTAIMCINDPLALGVMRGLHAHGVRIGQDLAVTGFDDLEFASMLSPPMTSVRRPKDQFGRRAVELLLDEIENPETHVHQQVVFQSELIVRGSSDFVRAED